MRAPPRQQPQSRIGPAGRAALQLLACCPRIPTDVAGVLLGHRHVVSTAQLLARLNRAGLAHAQIARLGPLLGSRRVRLWALTAAGRALILSRGAGAFPKDATYRPYGEPECWHDPARQRDVPLLVASYRLLAALAASFDRPLRVGAWEHPWVRTFTRTEGRGRQRVRLPAAAVLQSSQLDGNRPIRVLLLPDLGTAPLASYRPTLQALLDVRRTVRSREDEPLLIIGVATSPSSSGARAAAWQSLLQQVARRTDDRPLQARVLTLATGLASGPARGSHQPGQADELFALIARHPLLTRQQLASLLDTSARRIAGLEAALARRGWLRRVSAEGLPHRDRLPTRVQVQRLGLVELTEAGRREAARRLLVPVGLARRRHGITWNDARGRRLLHQFEHTLGANAFFVELATAARQATSRGADDALLEWRSAAACARGRFRPDGYGCYRHGPWQFGFFLEYDRGTERPRQYAAKLAAYYHYRDSGASTRDYQGFPTLLVVTTNDDAEARFAFQGYLAQERRGKPLPMFLTTASRIEACPDGALGPIWRSTAPHGGAQPMRGCWLPGRSGRTP